MQTKRIKGHFASKVNTGRVRVVNEDRAVSLINSAGDTLLCVCDGMGGHNKGDYASKLCVDIVIEEFTNKPAFHTLLGARWWINKTLTRANKEIFDMSENNPEYKGMGTTIVLALFVKQYIFIVNVGDSRAYKSMPTKLVQLSEDQSYVDYLYRTGKITEEEKSTSMDRNILMNAVGSFPSISFNINIVKNTKETILLCSDGLFNNASEKEINSVLFTNDSLDDKLNTLISIANSNGGSDNIGISIWEASKND